MYLRYILSFLVAVVMSAGSVMAKNVTADTAKKSSTGNILRKVSSLKLKARNDSSALIREYMYKLRDYDRQLDSINALKKSLGITDRDPRMYRLFIPATFYHSAAAKRLRINNSERGKDDVLDEVDNAMMNLYLSRPDLIVNNESRLESVGSIRNKIKKPIKHNVDLVDKVAPLPEDPGVAPMDIVVTRPNFWSFKGDAYLQFLQNYVSSNWYKGGEDSYSMVGSAVFEMNYNNKSRFKWDNKLELKLGFQTTNGDTLHSYKTSEDLIRLTSKVGLQAVNKWYYTVQMIATTQFTKRYKENDPEVYSDFMTPLNINLSLGMDYQVDTKDNKLTGNIHLAPIAYNLRYVRDKSLATRFGIDENEHVKHDIGSEFVCDLKWKILNNFSWQARLYGYTTYKRTEFEWENTFTFNFNRYISTKVFVYPRFDDGAQRSASHSYWQFQEFASLGFSYEF